MNALKVGTVEAMTAFLHAYPNSTLPGSELGASIAAGLDQPTAATSQPTGSSPGTPADGGISAAPADDGIY
jgi:hypothetical protein